MSPLQKLSVLCFVTFGLAACGGGGGGGDAGGGEPAGNGEAEPAPEAGNADATPPANATGAVAGKVALEGTPPERMPLNVSSDPVCIAVSQGMPPKSEEVISQAGGLGNVFVWVSKGLEGKRFPPPRQPVAFDQKGCVYSPHVFGVRVGQTIRITNSDPTLHNVHTLPKANQELNQGQPKGSGPIELKFRRPEPETMVKVKCEVHTWMNAYAGVVEHPYFAVSEPNGAFEFAEKLPPGKYTVSAWHEKYGKKDQEVDVAEGDNQVSFTFEAK